MSNNEKTTIFKALSLTDKYYIGENETAQEKEISFELIGLIAYLSSLPDNWHINATDIQRTGCGKDKAYKLLNELRELGFLNRIVYRHSDGTINRYEYQFFAIREDNPEYKPLPENPETVKPETVKQNIQSKEVKKEIEKDSIAPKSRDIKSEILLAFNSDKSVKLNTAQLSHLLGFKSDVFDFLPIGDTENYNYLLQELYHEDVLIWNDTGAFNGEFGRRVYWLAAKGETKATGNELDTIADLIAVCWKVNGGREKNLAHMLMGTARDNRYKQYSQAFKGDNQVTLDEIRQYPTWCKTKFGDNCELPLAPEKLSHRLLQMRDENKSKPTQSDISDALNAGYVPDD